MVDRSIESLKEVFVTQEKFGDYKETMAETVGKIGVTVGDMKGSVRMMKWLTGLIFVGIAADIILSILRMR